MPQLGQADREELEFLVDKLSNKIQALLGHAELKDDLEAQRLAKSVHLVVHALKACARRLVTVGPHPPKEPGND